MNKTWAPFYRFVYFPLFSLCEDYRYQNDPPLPPLLYQLQGKLETEKSFAQTFVIAGYLYLRFWTHRIGGLHRHDFIMAAKTDGI